MKADQGQFEGRTTNGQLESSSARDAPVWLEEFVRGLLCFAGSWLVAFVLGAWLHLVWRCMLGGWRLF